MIELKAVMERCLVLYLFSAIAGLMENYTHPVSWIGRGSIVLA